jgi:hypothetical protein
MSENFRDFQFFVEWHMRQVGFGAEGYDLDKDILVPGNKLYSEDTCVLVPRGLNYLFRSKVNGSQPELKGVCFHKVRKKFQATISLSGRTKSLGFFDKADDAGRAYRLAHAEELERWLMLFNSGATPIDPRVIERLQACLRMTRV